VNKIRIDKQSLTVRSHPDNLEKVQDFVRVQAKKSLVPDSTLMRLELIVEELVLNVINHGYRDRSGNITLSCKTDRTKKAKQSFILVIQDWGIPFNPLAKPDTDTSLDIESREPGGLGILLTKQMGDILEYHDDGASNILSVTIQYSPCT
jgi:anti-sigma regulatory factor (Ser/Thr protein kinase)